jgi:hypothetical protein
MTVMEFLTTIKIEGQDNNVSSVLTRLTNNQSVFMDNHGLRYMGAEMYGLTDNPRWFGVDLYIQGRESVDNEKLDAFRKEFPNVNAEVVS